MGREGGAMKALGEHLAKAQDVTLREVDASAGRARFVALANAPAAPVGKRMPLRTFAFAIAAAFAIGALVVAFVLPRRAAPIAFRLEGAPVVADAWFGGGAAAFSDGTRVTLAANGRARIAETTDRGARVVLEHGSLEADVVHRDATAWSFFAGPYEVRVTGTRFKLSWDPASKELDLAMRQGSVTVVGPSVGEGLAVRAGETIHLAPEAHGALAPSALPAAPPSAVPSAAASASASASARARGEPDEADAPTSWKALAAAGKYHQAMARVDEEGFANVSTRCDAACLLTLADVARLSGRADRASDALLAVRSRFAGSSESATAAFLLGRLAFNGRAGDAEHWFKTYLAEQPGGAFAREAEGRLLELSMRRGDGAEARAAARTYLDHYPTGPHADEARRILAP
jgi:transmembrane sensor